MIFKNQFTIIIQGGNQMKKLVVKDTCIGCGMCIAIDNEHFDFQDNLSHATNNENLDSEALQNAISSCPVGAIEIVDEPEEEK